MNFYGHEIKSFILYSQRIYNTLNSKHDSRKNNYPHQERGIRWYIPHDRASSLARMSWEQRWCCGQCWPPAAWRRTGQSGAGECSHRWPHPTGQTTTDHCFFINTTHQCNDIIIVLTVMYCNKVKHFSQYNYNKLVHVGQIWCSLFVTNV